MKALPHQIETANKAYPILKSFGYVYINGQPRSGKTLTSIILARMYTPRRVMVLTKKAAIEGWNKFIDSQFVVTNYEHLARVSGRQVEYRFNPKDFALVIIDESHNIGAFPKASSRQKIIKLFTKDLPHIHLSGTPIIESANTIYHQMNLGCYSPFKQFNTFYDFFRFYGIPRSIWVRGQQIPQYDQFKPELLNEIQKFTVYMSQQDAGINIEVEDKVHYIELEDTHKKLYNTLLKKKVIEVDGEQYIADSVMKLRMGLHQLEGGTLKIDDTYKILDINEKVKYMLANFSDSEETGIMCHFQAERTKLKQYFKKALLLSSNAHAEGVDLSHLKNFVIYSSDYSGARFVQRRERIVNINGSNTTIVHHLLVKGGISEQVYSCVSDKRDFNNETFYKEEL